MRRSRSSTGAAVLVFLLLLLLLLVLLLLLLLLSVMNGGRGTLRRAAYLLLRWEIVGTSHSFWSSRDKLKYVEHSDISAAFESYN